MWLFYNQKIYSLSIDFPFSSHTLSILRDINHLSSVYITATCWVVSCVSDICDIVITKCQVSLSVYIKILHYILLLLLVTCWNSTVRENVIQLIKILSLLLTAWWGIVCILSLWSIELENLRICGKNSSHHLRLRRHRRDLIVIVLIIG